jgi:iron complex transport system substrate-binding protein
VLRAHLAGAWRAIAARAEAAGARPRVVTLEWIEPLLIGGTWMPELVALAGGTPVGAVAGRPAPAADARALRDLDPEVVVIKPCGFTLGRALAERAVIERAIVAAVSPAARVYVTDGNAFFNRPGPRLRESLEILAACVHPEVFAGLGRKHAAVIERLQ